MRLKFADIAVRTAVVYWIAATLWIALSDRILAALVSDVAVLNRIQTYKGWIFVTLSAFVLLAALRVQLRIADRESERRRKAEDDLRLKGAALDAAANSIVITDREGSIVWVNRAFSATSGYSLEEALGKNPRDLTKSGRHDDTFYRAMWETITAGRVWRGEVTNRCKDGRLIIEDLTITPVCDECGEIRHFVGIKQELTEKKRLEAPLARAQKLEAIGRMAGGIAHDLNNVLTPVMAGAPLLRDEVRTTVGRELLENIIQCAHRGAGIVRQILMFSRGVGGAHTSVRLDALVEETKGIIRRTFPENVTVRTEMAAGLDAVSGDATQLHQLLMNLCVNARDAMPNGGELTISLRNFDVDEHMAKLAPEAKAGRHVALCVRDTGTGIAPEHIQRIFDPFFTTKEVGKGTGLGLASVLNVVRGHHGILRVESTLGVGTEFTVLLPAAPAEGPVPLPAPTESPRGNGELVLVADDQSSIRGILRQLLEHGGYRVIEAADGTEALDKCTSRMGEVRVVIADAAMEYMPDVSFVKALSQKGLTVPVLAITGNRDPDEAAQMRRIGASRILTKPFLPHDLLEALEQCIRADAKETVGHKATAHNGV